MVSRLKAGGLWWNLVGAVDGRFGVDLERVVV